MARPARTAAVAKPAKSPAKKPAVAKVKKASASAAPKKIRSHPTYYEMIVEAIVALKERTGSSGVAIAKHVEDKQGKNLPENFKKLLSNQLKKCVASGKLTKVKNSYKLSAPAKPAAAEKKVVKKPAEKKVVKKPAEKKETLKRKRAPADGEKKSVKKAPAAKKAAAVVKKAVAVKKSPAKKVVKPKTKSIKSPAGKKLKK